MSRAMTVFLRLRNWVQYLLDRFYDGRKWLATAVAYLSIRFYGVEVSFEDVRNGAYKGCKAQQIDFRSGSDLSGLLELSKECLRNANDRRKQVTDKCKTLLTLASLLLAVVGAFLPESLSSDSHYAGIALVISAAALLNVLMLLLVFFDIGTEAEVRLEPELTEYESDDLKKHLVNAQLYCASTVQNRTDYLVDVYRTARFFFVSAFLPVVFLLYLGFSTEPSPTSHEQAIVELRGDLELIELLRGPKGDRGDDAKIDTGDLVDEVLDDPRLEQAIQEIVDKDRQAVEPGVQAAK